MTWISPMFGGYQKILKINFQSCTHHCCEKMQNPLTTCKHYPEEVSIILLFFFFFNEPYIDLSQLVRLKIFRIQQLNFLYALASR